MGELVAAALTWFAESEIGTGQAIVGIVGIAIVIALYTIRDIKKAFAGLSGSIKGLGEAVDKLAEQQKRDRKWMANSMDALKDEIHNDIVAHKDDMADLREQVGELTGAFKVMNKK